MVTCPKCKEIYHENATHCPACGTEAPKSKSVSIEMAVMRTTPDIGALAPGLSVPYASIGDRALAYIIDFVIFGVCSAVLSAIIGEFGTFVSFILSACYFGYFESSDYMGTPGKIIMKLKVISTTGQRISFLNGVGRYAAKLVSAIILGIGFLFPLFTPKKQALHDIIAGCLVIKSR